MFFLIQASLACFYVIFDVFPFNGKLKGAPCLVRNGWFMWLTALFQFTVVIEFNVEMLWCHVTWERKGFGIVIY